MCHLKENAAMNHRTMTSRTNRKSTPQANLPEGSIFSTVSIESRPEGKLGFLEDFNMEHSGSNVSVSFIAFSAAAEAVAKRSANTASLSSPSCVYLG
jgi:hypothetical protein